MSKKHYEIGELSDKECVEMLLRGNRAAFEYIDGLSDQGELMSLAAIACWSAMRVLMAIQPLPGDMGEGCTSHVCTGYVIATLANLAEDAGEKAGEARSDFILRYADYLRGMAAVHQGTKPMTDDEIERLHEELRKEKSS